MTPKIKTYPDLLLTSKPHQEAKALGPEHFSLWNRNVADHFKDKTIDEVKAALKETAIPLAVCFENWINDFNISTGIRNANAFNLKEVFYVGDKRWDRRGAVGVHNYTEVQWIPTIKEFVVLKDRYTIIGIDNVPGSVPINTYKFVPNSLIVFGEEGVGLTPAMQSLCKDIVYIPMAGSVRSLNCATASGIAMYHYICNSHDI
jgi:tRNA G18 (ribose-2'-O)-methylase SpoU